MWDKINISQIVRDHCSTLQNSNSKKPGKDDYFTFLFTPIIITAILVVFQVKLTDEAINIIITTLSILVGLLFNVIVLIFDIIKRDASKQTKNIVLHELLSNISFTILVSIMAIILTLFTFIKSYWVNIVFTACVYFLLANFIITVLMILKRIHRLFDNEMKEIKKLPGQDDSQ